MAIFSQLNDTASTLSYTNSATSVVVRAGGGNDTVIGSNFGDAINGQGGNDRISGGAGKDTLDGGDGSDRIFGGAGSDTFVFRKGEISNDQANTGLMDHIIDFQGAGGYFAGDNDFMRFQGFSDGATLSYVRDATSTTGAKIYQVTDTDGYKALLMIQFADHFQAGVDVLNGSHTKGGSYTGSADFGWYA